MSDTIFIILAALAVVGISYAFGRQLGGRWLAIFAGLMVVAAGVLFASAMMATGQHAGLGEIMIFFFLWVPVAVCGAIGAIIGWVVRARANTPTNPPPVP